MGIEKTVKTYIFLLFFVSSTFFWACRKPNETLLQDIATNPSQVLILNQGNFTYGNASLSVYDKTTQQMQNQVFFAQNQRYLGDVAQSVTQIDNKLFLVVNNSSKIEIINSTNLKSIGTITGLVSPRFLVAIGPNEAVVSDLYSTELVFVDTQNHTITSTLNIGNTSEQIVVLDSLFFVANWSSGNTVQVIHVHQKKIVHQIQTGLQPNSMVLDKNNHLWVLCDGAFAGSSAGHELAKLLKINTSNFDIENTFVFESLEYSPTQLHINRTKDELFFLNEDVFKMNITDEKLPEKAFVQANGRLFYALGIDPEIDEMYVTDAIDYQQAGIVFRYNSAGELVHRVYADVIPGFIHFLP